LSASRPLLPEGEPFALKNALAVNGGKVPADLKD
jgi:hypothetical protein